MEIANSEKPSVVVLMAAFNNERFIDRAITGVLSQKTKFPYKIILSNDGSADKTKEICQQYVDKFQSQVELISSDVNTNLKIVLELFERGFSSGASYMALCDGDDYWTDPNKLQKQVDFLETHSEYTLCQHRTEMVWEYAGKKPQLMYCDKNEFKLEDLFERNIFSFQVKQVSQTHTSSCLYRMNLFKDGLPPWFGRAFYGDRALEIWAALHGKIKVLPDVMSVYRHHENSLSKKHFGDMAKSFKYRCECNANDFNLWLEVLPEQYHGQIKYVLQGIELVSRYEQKIHRLNAELAECREDSEA